MTVRTLTAIALIAVAGPFAATAAAASPDEKAIRQLNVTNRAKTILQFLHLGSEYVSHKLTGSGSVTANGKVKPGHFYLEYTYYWKTGGGNDSTTISFFFDAQGVLTETQIDKTTAKLNQPFFLANLGIKALGQVILEAAKKDLTATQTRQLQKFIDDANAKGFLELALAIDLVTSK